MKNYIILTIFTLLALTSFAQDRGLTYQAVIYNPSGQSLPGEDDALSPLVETNICLKFSIIGSGLEYEETVQTTTDMFGMVNIKIGANTQTGGSASSISDVNWDSGEKSMRVELNAVGNCNSFVQISYQTFSYVPFAYYAQNDSTAEAIADLQTQVTENQTASEIADEDLLSAIDAVQLDVDQNEEDADAAIAGLQAQIDAEGTDFQEALDMLQADVDENEENSDIADAGLLAIIEAAVAEATEAITANAIAIATTQVDVDLNEADSDAADAALQLIIEAAVAEATEAITNNAVAIAVNANSIAVVQADVDQNEADSDTADAALQAIIEAAIAEATDAIISNAVAIATTQADVDQNEADSDAADIAMQADIDQNEADADAADAALQQELDGTQMDVSQQYGLILTLESDVDNIENTIAVVQEDVNQNEADSDAAIAALQASAVSQLSDLSDVDGSGADNLLIGTSSYSNLAPGATNNTAVGVDALPAISTGDKNVAIGNDALLVAAAGLNNVAVGFNAAKKITSGSYNIAIGASASQHVVGGNSNISIGNNTGPGSGQGGATNRISIGSSVTNNNNHTAIIGNASTTQIWMAQDKEATVHAGAGQFSGDVTITGNLTVLGGVASGDTAAAIAVVQADVDQNESDADAAIAALQADVDGNEADSDAADAALQQELDGTQMDVSQQFFMILDVENDVYYNEVVSHTADVAMQADIDQNEADSDAADLAMQADVDQNEADSDAADVAMQADIDQNEADSDAADVAMQADIDQNEADADAAIAALQASAVSELNDLSDALVEGNSIYVGTPSSATSNAANNTAFGTGAMENITGGDNSVAIGYDALENVTSGTQNTVVGAEAGESLTTGGENVAIGYKALYSGTTAEENVAVGRDALLNATSAQRNVAVGQDAGDSVTTGDYNVIIGYDAGEEITTGARNVAIGATTGNDYLTTGSNNTMIGYGADVNSESKTNATVIGYNAIGEYNNSVTLGNSSVTSIYMADDSGATVYAAGFVGDVTGNVTGNLTGDVTFSDGTTQSSAGASELNDLSDATKAGTDNLLIGTSSYSNLATGATNNTAVGVDALPAISTGDKNVAIGNDALLVAAAGLNNVAVGFNAAKKITSGSYNIAIGASASQHVVGGNSNVSIGNNTGPGSGQGGASNRISIGASVTNNNNNTAIIGNANVTELWAAQDKGAIVYAGGFVGDVTGDVTGNLTGDVTGNVTGNLTGNADTATSLSGSMSITNLSDVSYDATGNNFAMGTSLTDAAAMTAAGYANSSVIGPGSNTNGWQGSFTLGDSNYTYVIAGSADQGSYVGAGFYNISDRRFKSNIIPLESSLESISKIGARRYFNNITKTNDIGVIAQEVQSYFPELVREVEKVNGESRLIVNYSGFVPILINAINEQQQIIEEQEEKLAEIDELRQEIETLKELILNQ